MLNVEMKRAYLESISCIDCGVSFGLPYEIFETDGFGGIYKIFWLGLVADILIGLIFSIGLGCVFQAIEKFIFVANGD